MFQLQFVDSRQYEPNLPVAEGIDDKTSSGAC
jgi:hypothetical protein